MELLEASKLNPGKKIILGATIGSKGAKAVVDLSTAALKSWDTFDKVKKKEVYQKLADLKAAAKKTLSADLKAAPADKKTAAKDQVDSMFTKFKNAVKKKENSKSTESDKESDAEFEARVRKEIEELKKEKKSKRADIDDLRRDISDTKEDLQMYKDDGDDDMAAEMQNQLSELKAQIAEIEEQIEELDDEIGMKESQFESSTVGYSMKHVMLFEQFINSSI